MKSVATLARPRCLVLRIVLVLLAPAENAFDHRPARLRHTVAFMPRGASVDGALTTLTGCGDAVALRHMRRNVDGAQMGHMVSRVIGLIFAHCDAVAGLLGFGLEHDLRSAALGSAVGKGDHAGDRQPMPVLHGGMAHVTELSAFPPGGLAVETAVGIAGACMRVIFALLAVEVGPAVVVAAAVLGAETLCEAHASISVPSAEKCSSDNSGLTSGWFRSLVMNLANTAPVCSRSRFFVKVVGSQIGSSGESPTNQRYKRL